MSAWLVLIVSIEIVSGRDIRSLRTAENASLSPLAKRSKLRRHDVFFSGAFDFQPSMIAGISNLETAAR